MAKFNPPENFTFEKPTEWPEWKQQFERYRIATKLHKDKGQVQVSCLIYAMGNEAENIFKSFTFAQEEECNDFVIVMGKFNDYFFPRRNTIHEWACFYQRIQRPGEKAECFIRALYDLSEHCEFEATREENIVVRILDEELSRRLQLMAELTLTQMIQTVRQSEEVAAQVSLQGDAAGSIQKVQFKRKSNGKPQQQQQGKSKNRKWGRNEKKCGKTQHNRDETCPAEKATCHNCHRMGHWARVCRSRSVNEVTETERAGQTSYFLGSVCDVNDKSEQWTVQLQVDSTPVEFKIDTGADVTVISEDTFHTLRGERALDPPDIPLESPGGELLFLGCFNATVSHKGKDYQLTAYVVCGRRVNNLLSQALSVRMNLVRRVDELNCITSHLQTHGEHGVLKT